MTPRFYRLSQILNRFKQIVDERVTGRKFWLKVEIAQINFHRSGHVYLELAETRENSVIAQCPGMIWSAHAIELRRKLGGDYVNVLKTGNEIVCQVELNFDIRYGLKVLIFDIDLSFLLGEIEKRKQENIERLKREGLMELNRSRSLPLVVQRIALIASSNTAGYEDFVQQLSKNPWGYQIQQVHFPSSVQGEMAITDIVECLYQTAKGAYDIVVLIRGGGSKMDLDVFNAYPIAEAIARCPHPVFTGIGHETDVSVADLVAHQQFKTPTAVASYLIERIRGFEEGVIRRIQTLADLSIRLITKDKTWLERNSASLVHHGVQLTQLERGTLHTTMNRIVQEANSRTSSGHEILRQMVEARSQASRVLLSARLQALSGQKELLELYLHRIFNNSRNELEKKSEQFPLYSPKSILGRGFVIPRFEGNLYRGEELPLNSTLELEFARKRIRVLYQGENDE